MCNLRRFDVVLRLEHDMGLLNATLGWKQDQQLRVVTDGRIINSNQSYRDAEDVLPSLPASVHAMLARKTFYDEKLYSFASELVTGERQESWRHHFAKVWPAHRPHDTGAFFGALCDKPMPVSSECLLDCSCDTPT